MELQHKQVICGNTRVFFPFEPYETQKEFMRSVIEALDKKQNALLESPTGTGKTLSLLCSSLAWVQGHAGPQSQSIIYYTSRTHMQLSQAAKEMKRTAYGRVPSVVMGSRVQMCLNDDVRSAEPSLINRTCRNAIARNACVYYTSYEHKIESMDQNTVHDIEDLAEFGKKHQCCPYYASKKLAESKATIVFMPYNYLLETSVRKSTQLKIDNSIIIFDEAHNIESALKDSVSGSFTESSLQVVQESCDKLPAKVHEALNREKHGLSRAGYDPKDKPGAIVDEFAKPKAKKQKVEEPKVNPIEELAEKLSNEKLQQVKNFTAQLIREIKQHTEPDKLFNIESIFRIMDRSGIRFSSSTQIITTLESMASFWSIAGVMFPQFVARHVSAISSLFHVLSILFPEVCTNGLLQEEHRKKLLQFYTVYVKGIYQESSHLAKGQLKDREINFWCLHPAIGLKKVFESTSIFGPRSMIVTSGTLEPMKSIQKELEVEFKIQKSFEHVISDEQLKILVINESFKKFNLKSDFQNLNRKEYPGELGNTLVSVAKILPFGTLIFFPSYSFMNHVVKVWKNKTLVWKHLTALCPVYEEQSNQDQFMTDVSAYKRITSSDNGNNRAIFLCVCRGKLSEGVNLEGNHCRTVIVVGVPFPNSKDPRIESTKKFHEGRGNTVWYKEQMRRALNQTIGRVIRSRTDFGLLLLVDPRFTDLKYSLSKWTLKFYPNSCVQTSHIENEIKTFFEKQGIVIKQSVTTSMGAFELTTSQSVTSMGAFELAISQPETTSTRALALTTSQPVTKKATGLLDMDLGRLSPWSDEDDDANTAPVLRDESSIPSTVSTCNYSITKQASDKDRPTTYTCCICDGEADRPHSTMCKCDRVGCLKCLMLLAGRKCFKCKMIMRKRDFKPRLFKSAFHSQERTPVIVIDHPAPNARAN